MMNEFYLYGASGHCKVIIDIIRLNNGLVKAVFDDNQSIKSILDIATHPSVGVKTVEKNLIISIGNNKTRKKIVETLNSNVFCTHIHPNTTIDDKTKIDLGTVIMAGVVINSSTQIGKHCIINTASCIDHDCILEDYVHISPNATLCGNVKVGVGSHIGAGSVIIQGITIGKNVTVGAGSVIIKNIPDNAVVVGNPGKIIKIK